MRAEGIRFLGYVNPYLAIDGGMFGEAREQGLLALRQDSDEPYVVDFGEFDCGIVDFTNPAAAAWFADRVIGREMLGVDMAGWMADFGEYLPTDLRLHDGSDPMLAHNRWPVLWAEVNARAIAAKGLTGEALFFMRAGHSGVQAHCPLLWAGDQCVDFSRHDGIGTVITAALSAGLVGNAYSHSDVGGYTSLHGLVRTADLLKRWAELGAFSPVMRTHEGNRPDDNLQVDSTPDILHHFAAMTRVHAALAPYLRSLCDEAADHGLPLQRPLFLHYPTDACFAVRGSVSARARFAGGTDPSRRQGRARGADPRRRCVDPCVDRRRVGCRTEQGRGAFWRTAGLLSDRQRLYTVVPVTVRASGGSFMSQRSNIRDVSARAGVSVKTVSRVLNDHPYVSQDTREKVEAAIRDLEFRPSVAARILAGTKSAQIALIYDNHSPYYINQIQAGCWARCHQDGIRLLGQPVDVDDPDVGDQVRGLVSETHVDGIILSSPVTDCDPVLRTLEQLGIPFVRISPGTNHAMTSSVFMDDAQAADDMTTHLINQGASPHRLYQGAPQSYGLGRAALRLSPRPRPRRAALRAADDRRRAVRFRQRLCSVRALLADAA